ncbi:MAG: copper homeostasis protein CutC [Planctomycetota bacterium]
MAPTLEVPIDSLAAADIAGPFADRLEVCSDLASEGWSPDPWLVRAIRARTRATVVAMSRPRVPGAIASLGAEAFRCTPALLDACLREIDALARAGAHGVAIGPLDGTRGIDAHACTRMIEVARGHGVGVSFLRTFDLLTDRDRAMREVVALGFDRLLTAGVLGWDASVRPLAERMTEVARTIAIGQAEAARLGRAPIEVMPCGSVRAANAIEWLGVTPHLHASCRRGASIDPAEVQALHALLRPAGR